MNTTQQTHGQTNNLPLLVHSLLTHGWGVETVKREHGDYGVAILLDGWYAERPDAELLGAWQETVDRLRLAAGVQDRGADPSWSGSVVK